MSSWRYKVENQKRYDSVTGEPSEFINHWIMDGDEYLAVLCRRGDEGNRARLMAASPEMLEVLKEARQVAGDYPAIGARIESLIARVEGGEK